MENRESVLADYFKLRLLLNRTNLVRDQRTEIDFEAHQTKPFEYKLVATLKGLKNPRHLELCRRSQARRWESSEYSGLIYLEDFCVTFLKKSLGQDFTYDDIRIAVDLLKKELQNLGIPQ